MCGVGLTTRTQESLTRDECRPECEDGHQLDLDGVCVPCPMGEYRSKGVHPGCMKCPTGYTTRQQGSTILGDCSLPVCLPGQHLSASTNECVECELGYYQPEEQQTECLPCPTDTTTNRRGATDAQECTNICKVLK